MPLMSPLAQFSSNALDQTEASLPTSPRSCNPLRPGIVPSTENSWQPTLPSSIFATLRKVGHFIFSLTLIYVDYILQFTSDIRHIKGSHNSAADALSRIQLEVNASHAQEPIDFQSLANAQQTDPRRAPTMEVTTILANLIAVPLPESTITLTCDISTGTS